MPRKPRDAVAGLTFHVIQRGHNRDACFYSDEDRRFYLWDLHRQASEHGLAVHAYVLMTNHVHLLVTPADAGSLTSAIGSLSQRYVQYFNKRHAKIGTLWQGRFRSGLIITDSHLLACHRYIELNPVRAKMVEGPHQWPWSSYHANALGEVDALVTHHPVVLDLAPEPEARRQAYRDLFVEGLPEETLEILRLKTKKPGRPRRI